MSDACGAIHPEHPGTHCRQPDGHRGPHATARWDVEWDNAYLSAPGTPMTDPRIAVLAEALHANGGVLCPRSEPHGPNAYRHMDDAAAILAALPDDWCGHAETALGMAALLGATFPDTPLDELRAAVEMVEAMWDRRPEIARLRRIEEAARESLAAGDPPAGWSHRKRADARLRAALEDGPL